ncbi:MAG TPA: cupin domain-containing protein [Candidatus Acidoferrum sp.]|jgi:anti-sigma factor ChrR (cupin superfamily)|nr:cupin domain-containing protein [Candidatus Acidoferrum sp.]
MITDQQQEQAALYVLGLLEPDEQRRFADQVRASAELRELLRSLQHTMERLVLALPATAPPPTLKAKVLNRIRAQLTSSTPLPEQLPAGAAGGLHFLSGDDTSGWKPLPIPGAWIKLLSFQPDRGYAVLLGKLEPGVRYPAHTNAGPEDFYILTGDLHVSGRAMGPGDFHHADAGSAHEQNYSLAGCTLLAVLTVDDPLVSFAMA